MKILTFTSLFPNVEQPNNAIFIRHRMAAVNRCENSEVRVVAPVPWYPDIPVGSERYRRLARVPHTEVCAGLPVCHPRYLVTPKVGMTLYGLSMFLGSLSAVRKLFQQWPFDIIDAHYLYPDGLAAIMLGKYFRVPVVVSGRGTDLNLYSQLKLIRPLLVRVAAKSDGLIAVSRSLAEVMEDLGANPEKIRVIPNGIDPELFHPLDKAVARQHIGLAAGRILLTVGSLIELKGIHLLVDALEKLHRSGRLDFSTYIIGKGEMKGRLQSQIAGFNLQDRVFLVGEVPNADLLYWYNAADLFFLGSSREGWPNVVSESLACGTPVIATRVSGIPEIISSPELGLLIERDVEGFAEALIAGFGKNWDRNLIARAGQARTWSRVAEEVVDFFAATIERVGKKS
jgi:glycosyltransferase involved in cell wall biosynthesis